MQISSFSSSTSSDAMEEEKATDLNELFAPLLDHTVNGEIKKRNNYNYYSEYTNEFFSRLFHDYLDPGTVSQQDAAEFFHIPPSTLSSKYNAWLNGGKGIIGIRDGRGRKRKLNNDDESLINEQVYERMDSNEKMQNGHLVDFIMNLYPSFHPSDGFLARYKKRSLDVSSRFTPLKKKVKQLSAADKEDEDDYLIEYYEKVEDAINRLGPSRVINYDEKPLSGAPRKVSSFQRRGKKTKPLESKGSPDQVYTAACAVAANGYKLPLTIIKKGVKRDSDSSKKVEEALDEYDNIMLLTRSGWVNSKSMIEWIKNILIINIELPCALIMDGYKAHWTEEVRGVASTYVIELISMPPNHTNEIQPLDVGVFGALQAMTDRDWESNHTAIHYLSLFQKAWEDFAPENIRKAFYKALALKEGMLEEENNNEDDDDDVQNATDQINAIYQQFIHNINNIPK